MAVSHQIEFAVRATSVNTPFAFRNFSQLTLYSTLQLLCNLPELQPSCGKVAGKLRPV